MKNYLYGLCLFLACSQNPVKQENDFQSLELVSHHQLVRIDSLNFDLSGMVKENGSTCVIADKPWNSFLYQIRFDSNKWYIKKQMPFETDTKLDLEAIDQCGAIFYLADERNGKIYQFVAGEKPAVLAIDFDTRNITPGEWGNAGWEGLAVDCKNNRLYLLKERQPRYILSVDLSTLKIIDQFNIPETESDDFADAKYKSGHLYLLERNGNYITKINPKTHEVINKYHYRHIASHPDGKLFGPEKYGMAEALVLTESEIWIGLDNNGKNVTDHGIKSLALSGNEPVILKFKRPEGF
jgi:hypothetical protein